MDAPIPLILAFPPPIELLCAVSPAKSFTYDNINIYSMQICVVYVESALCSHAVRHEYLQQVIGHFIVLLNLLDVSSHNCLLLFEHSDGSEHLHVHQLSISHDYQVVINLLVVKVLEGDGDLVLSFLVENDLGYSSVVIHLEDSPHWLLNSLDYHTHKDNLCWRY